MKVEAIKDGNGNIVITEDSFEILLACLDNQKFVGETPQNGDSLSFVDKKIKGNYFSTQNDIQKTIDYYNRECRKILHQKYIFELREEGYFLAKKYEYQKELTKWSGEDVGKVYELFKDTRIEWEKPKDLLPLDGTEEIKKGTEPIGKNEEGWMFCEPEPQPWLIERSMRCDYEYLTISEDGKTNRPWKKEEVEMIEKIFNGTQNDSLSSN